MQGEADNKGTKKRHRVASLIATRTRKGREWTRTNQEGQGKFPLPGLHLSHDRNNSEEDATARDKEH